MTTVYTIAQIAQPNQAKFVHSDNSEDIHKIIMEFIRKYPQHFEHVPNIDIWIYHKMGVK